MVEKKKNLANVMQQNNPFIHDLSFPSSPVINDRERNRLDAQLTIFEVKNPLFSMQPLKALGPDGFQPKFYQTL